ncbi:MAG: xylulokinase, partial [Burkholderiaceae bacterium]
EGFVSLGTSGVVFVASDQYTPNPAQAVHAFCHALPNRWHQMSVMLSAASALSWAKRTLNVSNEGALLDLAATLPAPARAHAPLFLPYLTGERSPHNNANAQATWFGLTATHDTAALAYAVAEGVGFGLLDGLQTLALGHATGLSVVGGGSRSDWWLQLLADIFQLDLHLHSGATTGAALGAARLGWLATLPQTAANFERVCVRPPIEKTFTPDRGDTTLHELLAKRHARFRALYQATKPLMVAS